MNLELSIKQLGPGRHVCPFCCAVHERSFGVSQDKYKPHILWFRCFRASCGAHGSVIDRGGLKMLLMPSDDAHPHRVDRPLPEHNPVHRTFQDMIGAKYHLFRETLDAQGCRYNPHRNSLCMPWLSATGHQRGWVEKIFDRLPRKSHHDLIDKDDEGRLCYPRHLISYKYIPKVDICILTEDLLSAYRVGQDYPSMYGVAMLGGGVSSYDAATLGQTFNRVIVHTDSDVWPQTAIQLMNKLKAYTQVRASTSELDIKDMPIDKLQAHLQSLEECFT